jgi:hypothetical protein
VRKFAVEVFAVLVRTEIHAIVHLGRAPAFVLGPVVLGTLLRVVRLLVRALVNLELLQVQMLAALVVNNEQVHATQLLWEGQVIHRLLLGHDGGLCSLDWFFILYKFQDVVRVVLDQLLLQCFGGALQCSQFSPLLLLQVVDLVDVRRIGARLDVVLLLHEERERRVGFLLQLFYNVEHLLKQFCGFCRDVFVALRAIRH